MKRPKRRTELKKCELFLTNKFAFAKKKKNERNELKEKTKKYYKILFLVHNAREREREGKNNLTHIKKKCCNYLPKRFFCRKILLFLFSCFIVILPFFSSYKRMII